MDVILTHPLFNVAIGAALTWFAAWYYYKRAGDDLRRESRTLHAATRAILYFLENPGANVTVQRGDDGNVKGLIVSAAGRADMTFRASGSLTDGANT